MVRDAERPSGREAIYRKAGLLHERETGHPVDRDAIGATVDGAR